MPRYCIVTEGAVINTIDYDSPPGNPPPGFDVNYAAIQTDIAQIGWLWNGSEFTDPDPSPAPQIVYVPSLIAQARLEIFGDEINGVDVAAGVVAALEIDTAIYWVFFIAPQPDANYGVLSEAQGTNGVRSKITDQTTDYIEVTVTDQSGVPLRPTSLFLSIQRAN